MRSRRSWIAFGAVGVLGGLWHLATAAEHPAATRPPAPAPASIRVTMMELHSSPSGVPRGWKFTLPPGDAKAGREAFVKFECFKCHTVQGERFPQASKGATDVGPDLTGMGGQHPPEFFAQSVIDPNAVILDEPGYTGPDGKSRMPDYTESMSVRELINVVAYLESLKGGAMHMEMPSKAHGAAPSKSTGGMPGMKMPESKDR